MLETFGLSNISPQVGKGFNRSAAHGCLCPWNPITHRRMTCALASMHFLKWISAKGPPSGPLGKSFAQTKNRDD